MADAHNGYQCLLHTLTSDYSSHPPPTSYIPIMSSHDHHTSTDCTYVSRNVYYSLWKLCNFTAW